MSGEKQRALAYRDELNQFRLLIDDGESSFFLGNAQAAATLILGKDFDNSGFADAVLILNRRKRWQWRLALNPFADNGTRREVIFFAPSSSTPFILQNRGKEASLGSLVRRKDRTHIRFRTVRRPRIKRTRIKDLPSQPTSLLTVRTETGKDNLVFVFYNEENLSRVC